MDTWEYLDICVCVFAYKYVCVYICVCLYIYICVCVCVCVDTWERKCEREGVEREKERVKEIGEEWKVD